MAKRIVGLTVVGLTVALSALSARPATGQAAPDYTLAVMPDVQIYSRDADKRHIHTDVAEWLASEAATRNIRAVLYPGDLVEYGSTHGADSVAEWDAVEAGVDVLNAAGSAGDPWSTALPGAYASGTAGNIIGNIASTVWDRLTSALTTSGSIGAYIVSKLGGTTITTTAPVASGGDVTICIGDDYSNTDSRALDWTSSGWPNLTSATSITLVALEARTTGANWSITGSAPTAGAGSQTIRMVPTAAETALLKEQRGTRFQIEAVLSSGRIVTLVDARLTAVKDIA